MWLDTKQWYITWFNKFSVSSLKQPIYSSQSSSLMHLLRTTPEIYAIMHNYLV